VPHRNPSHARTRRLEQKQSALSAQSCFRHIIITCNFSAAASLVIFIVRVNAWHSKQSEHHRDRERERASIVSRLLSRPLWHSSKKQETRAARLCMYVYLCVVHARPAVFLRPSSLPENAHRTTHHAVYAHPQFAAQISLRAATCKNCNMHQSLPKQEIWFHFCFDVFILLLRLQKLI
jgi:hypothetical protein